MATDTIWKSMAPDQQRTIHAICRAVSDRPGPTPWRNMTPQEQHAWLELPEVFKRANLETGRVDILDWDL